MMSLELQVIKEEHYHGDNSSDDEGHEKKSHVGSDVSLRMARPECLCHQKTSLDVKDKLPTKTYIEELLIKKELELKAKYDKLMKDEIATLQDKIDSLLQNEQVRASYLLAEAQRDRQEKISALQRQLQSKNLSALMYVLCTERRKSRLEKVQIISEFTSYIKQLKSILKDGQEVILDLARGYKSAARVDREWREKMQKILKEFKCFIRHYAGGTPEQNEYLLDTAALLAAPTPPERPEDLDSKDEDEVEDEEEETRDAGDDASDPSGGDNWWEQLSGPELKAPFIMYGDMSEFKAPQRREVLKVIKGAKKAPKNWKEYVFDDMRVRYECANLPLLREQATRRPPHLEPWREVHGSATAVGSINSNKSEVTGRSCTMGSILKMFAASNIICEPVTKAVLLAARDSTEIASSTKLLNKQKPYTETANVDNTAPAEEKMVESPPAPDINVEEVVSNKLSVVDSLNLETRAMSNHSNKIMYDKYCPVEKCKLLRVDSFVRSLPAYMHAGACSRFEQDVENYEVCSPEQIKILKQRISEQKESLKHAAPAEGPLAEWQPRACSAATQTEPPQPRCSCFPASPAPSYAPVIDMRDIWPVKELIDCVRGDLLYSERVQLRRCCVVGEPAPATGLNVHASLGIDPVKFRQSRVAEITDILRQHPSLVDMFQSNTRC